MFTKLLRNKIIFLTGGTGSFGKAFVKNILKYKIKKLIIFSRDESKQWDMKNEFKDSEKIKFCIGDIRDKNRLYSSINEDVDYVIHAAATKIVPTAETNPEECVKTNVLGTINLIQVCKEKKIKRVIGLSTDKACNPVNLYGATKLAADKLMISANEFKKSNNSIFSVVRYGNVLGSRGSVIPFFKKMQQTKNYIPITDKRMTRFIISLNEAVNFVLLTLNEMKGGEIFVKKIPSMNILNIANSIKINPKIKYIGIRPGEKLHETMISYDDSLYTYEFDKYYKIIPNINNNPKYYKANVKRRVKDNFCYSSDQNNDWKSHEYLSNWIKNFPNYY